MEKHKLQSKKQTDLRKVCIIKNNRYLLYRSAGWMQIFFIYFRTPLKKGVKWGVMVLNRMKISKI